jgi:outer membrane biosynthesis protein TonB
VSAEYSERETLLREEVERSELVLLEFERELQEVNGELEALAQKSHQYDLLSRACHSLEELDTLGAAHLFWSEQSGSENSIELLGKARREIEKFGEEIARLEDCRQSVIEKIGDKDDVLDALHYELQEAVEREEERKNEWLIEREVGDLPYRAQVMPWARGCEEDQRFRKSLATSAAAAIGVAMLFSMIALPILERDPVTELPERVAKLVREKVTPPPPPVAIEEPVIPDEPLPEPELVDELPPEPTNVPQLADVEQPDTREQVKSKGILAFRDSFASRASLRPMAQLGSQARVTSAGEDAVGRPQRMMVTTSAPGSSGGINLANISRDVGGGGQGIAGVQVSRVASSIGGGSGPDRPLSGGGLAGRTDEEIQIVFDRYKASLYRLYNRELRKDPTLRGQLVLRMTIQPDGSVSFCQLQSSDMDAPALAQQVVDRVLTFDFGAKEDIVAMTIIYPIDFLPAA